MYKNDSVCNIWLEVGFLLPMLSESKQLKVLTQLKEYGSKYVGTLSLHIMLAKCMQNGMEA